MSMFNNSQRNFEWFEASFTKKIQHIINENSRDNASWVRDLFISILLAILPLACELILNHSSANNQAGSLAKSNVVYTICTYGAVISLVGFVLWAGFCIWKYNKAVQKFKRRVIPHTIKGTYSIDESVHYFDNDVCNDLILSKYYISLSMSEMDVAVKDFYFIESLHYYYKSIRRFCIICKSHNDADLQKLFTSNRAGADKRIDIIRLLNYLTLIKSIRIPVNSKDDPSIYEIVLNYNASFELIVSTFASTYLTLQEQFPLISQFSKENEELIQITQDINEHILHTKTKSHNF